MLSKNKHSVKLLVKLTEREEGRGSWYELCFWCYQFEIVVTGALYNDGYKLGAFLRVTIPSFIEKTQYYFHYQIQQLHRLELECREITKKKNASLKEWYFKSSFFFKI